METDEGAGGSSDSGMDTLLGATGSAAPVTVLFTSGTSGPPKGAVVPERSWLAMFAGALQSNSTGAGPVSCCESNLSLSAPRTSSLEVLAAGGRLDPWDSQLSEGSRPKGMRATDCDALVVGAHEAWSTAVERPTGGGTLLATQRWQRNGEGDSWRLATHRTIPWDADGGTAVVTLRCDGRGCVALAREINTRERLSWK